MKLWVIVLIFLVIGGYIIVQANNINLKQGEDREEFIFRFTDWLVGLGRNIVDLTGQAIAQDWLPNDNGTNETPDTDDVDDPNEDDEDSEE